MRWEEKHVFWFRKGDDLQGSPAPDTGWYWFDEAGLLGGGPYSKEEAMAAVRYYEQSLQP